MSNVTEPNIGMIVFGVRSSIDSLIDAINKYGFEILTTSDCDDLVEVRNRLNLILYPQVFARQETE